MAFRLPPSMPSRTSSASAFSFDSGSGVSADGRLTPHGRPTVFAHRQDTPAKPSDCRSPLRHITNETIEAAGLTPLKVRRRDYSIGSVSAHLSVLFAPAGEHGPCADVVCHRLYSK